MDAEETAETGIEPRLLAGEAAFGPLWEAVRDRRPVTFAYRAAGRSEPQQRHLQPWGVVNRHGRWYVAGHDSDRDAARVFRLSRIEGDVRFSGPAGSVIVPEGTDVRETVREWDTQPPAAAADRDPCGCAPGAGLGLRRHGTVVAGPPAGRPGRTGADRTGASLPGGWDTHQRPVLATSGGSLSTSRRSARTWSRSSPPISGRPSSPS